MRWSLIEIEMESRFHPPENRVCPQEGFVNDKAQIAISDKELLNQFKEVEKLSQEDKHLIKTFIDAFLTKRKIQQLAV